MTKNISKLLEKRTEIKKNRPKIRRSDSWKFIKLDENSWRKPKGRHNKMRLRRKGHVQTPSYGVPKAIKGFHSSGKKEKMIYNINDLNKINKKDEVARLSKTIGKKTRIELLEKAFKEKIKILNPGIKAKKELLTKNKKDIKEKTKETKKTTQKKETTKEKNKINKKK
jgi:large subunit ribosomal protein L32e